MDDSAKQLKTGSLSYEFAHLPLSMAPPVASVWEELMVTQSANCASERVSEQFLDLVVAMIALSVAEHEANGSAAAAAAASTDANGHLRTILSQVPESEKRCCALDLLFCAKSRI